MAVGTRLIAVGGCEDVFAHDAAERITSTVEVYDDALGHWSVLGRLALPKTCAAVTPMDDSRVFIAGGEPIRTVARSSVEILHVDGDEGKDEGKGAGVAGGNPFLGAELSEWRRGCQAAVVQLPQHGSEYPVCRRRCAVVVGGECLEAVDKNLFVSAFDIDSCEWCDGSLIPPTPVPRTAVALCVGVGRVDFASR